MLDVLVQPRRCARSAERLMRKLLKRQGFAPKRITSDKLQSYAGALRTLRLFAVHDQGLRANNRAEHSHQPDEDASENGNDSSHQGQPNGSCRSTPPSTTPSTSNAILCLAASSSSFALRRLLSGTKAGLSLNPDHARVVVTAAVNVSKPAQVRRRRSAAQLREPLHATDAGLLLSPDHLQRERS